MTTLLVPDTVREHGSGHLRRCARLLTLLPRSLLLIPERGDEVRRGADELGELLQQVPRDRIVAGIPADTDRVVLDLFHLDVPGVLAFSDHLTIGLDLGGPGRELCSYLIDILPRVDRSTVNLHDPTLIDLPGFLPLGKDSAGTILVSFGGEDPAGLTEKTVAILVDRIGVAPGKISVLRPALRVLEEVRAGVEIVDPVPSISGLLRTHETVICSFGMTAMEASSAGRRVVTIAPTRYHDQLSELAGFSRAGVHRPAPGRLRRMLVSDPAEKHVPARGTPVNAGCGEALQPEEPRGLGNLAAVIEGLVPAARGCPAHPGSLGEALWRDSRKSYFVCPECATVYMERFNRDEESYGSSYFFEEYRLQYGKTYLDDFQTIYARSRVRLGRARELAPDVRTVLDLGCAFGPFIKAAADSGLEVYGVDVSEEAVAHVRRTLGLRAEAASLLEIDCGHAFDRTSFDLVTLWYVIEHFRELAAVLQRLRLWVRPGGLLAISTPNLCGVSGSRDPDRFFAQSPRDHYTVWHPASARLLLSEHGFRVEKIVCTGHHPERYPLVQKGLIPEWFAALHSRLFRRGDTFEIYARRGIDE